MSPRISSRGCSGGGGETTAGAQTGEWSGRSTSRNAANDLTAWRAPPALLAPKNRRTTSGDHWLAGLRTARLLVGTWCDRPGRPPLDWQTHGRRFSGSSERAQVPPRAGLSHQTPLHPDMPFPAPACSEALSPPQGPHQPVNSSPAGRRTSNAFFSSIPGPSTLQGTVNAPLLEFWNAGSLGRSRAAKKRDFGCLVA